MQLLMPSHTSVPPQLWPAGTGEGIGVGPKQPSLVHGLASSTPCGFEDKTRSPRMLHVSDLQSPMGSSVSAGVPPAGRSLYPQTLATHVRLRQGLSTSAVQSVGSIHSTQWPAPSQTSLPPAQGA